MTIRLTFILLLFFTLGLSAVGQLTYPPYRQYTLRDGLSQMQAMRIIQDSRGYIWVGTKEGLNCFNGDEFTSYSEKDGLMNSFIQDVAEDDAGKIWVSTRMGLASFDGCKFTSYPHNDQLSVLLEPTPDGKIWYAGMDHNRKNVLGYFEDGKYIDKTSLLPDKRGGFLFEYCRKENSFVIASVKEIFELKDNKIKHLLNCEFQASLVGNDSTVLIYDQVNNLIVNIWEYCNREISYIGKCKDNNSEITKSTNGSYTFVEGTSNHIITLNPDGLIRNKITTIVSSQCLVDRDKQLWLATEEGLLKVFSGGFETYKREVLPVIWSVVEDMKQNLWFASYNYGVFEFNGETIKHHPTEKLRNYALNFYFQPQVDKRGILYFPNNFGIFYMNGNVLGDIIHEPCLATYYDKERDLLFGGYRMFVEVYDKNHKLVRKITESDGLEFKGYISSFGIDLSGNIWMGGFSGLCKYNWETREIKNYNRDNSKLPSDGVLSIFTTPEGRTWFGGSHGLLWYDSKTDSIKKIEQKDISGSVSFVTAIDSTWLVFSQSTGIYLMNLKKFNKNEEVELFFFNENNGFLGIDPGQNGALVDSKGNIWMTTSTEVVKLDPKKLDLKTYSTNVRISHFNGQRLPFDNRSINLPKNDRSSVIQFETICFNRPNAAEFSWKIGDNNNEWSPWQKENYAVLTNLNDGESILQVKSRISGLPGSEAIVKILLTVDLALWKQDWFFPALLGLVSLLVLLALLLFFQARIKMIQINKQAKMFQLQAILSQMNPHFIFNVMASLQSMIITANIEKANEYLVKMSNLVRGFLESSISTSISKSNDLRKSELPLQNTLEVIHNYIQFQQLIYPDKFDYEIFISPEIDPFHQLLPPMLIQPFVENAIRHGLLQKKDKGMLRVSITRTEKNHLNIEIADDGIGIKKAGEMIRRSNLLYTSRGKELTLNRIKLLNELGYNIQFDTVSSDLGTKVTITIGYDEK